MLTVTRKKRRQLSQDDCRAIVFFIQVVDLTQRKNLVKQNCQLVGCCYCKSRC